VIRRLLALFLLVWALGFVLFVVALPRPAGQVRTDGIVVPTGAPGRIARGSDVIRAGLARRMLISGVERTVRPGELAEKQAIPMAVVACCIDLGRQAVDTRSNAAETVLWVRRHGYRSIRLVTTDWHMPRARFELSRALGDTVVIVPDALRSNADLIVLWREYNKYLLRRTAALAGL